jgi:hypothetical protein
MITPFISDSIEAAIEQCGDCQVITEYEKLRGGKALVTRIQAMPQKVYPSLMEACKWHHENNYRILDYVCFKSGQCVVHSINNWY